MSYLGRIIALGKSESGELVGMYRVSSRSFSQREAIRKNENLVSIELKKEYWNEHKDKPYITYNCLIGVKSKLILANGNHSDFIAQKINDNYSSKDALMSVLSLMDYEHDELNTPRIAGIICQESGTFSLGIIREDGLEVKTFTPKKGKVYYLATYEHNSINEKFQFPNFKLNTSTEACQYILNKGPFKQFTFPIIAVASLIKKESLDTQYFNLK